MVEKKYEEMSVLELKGVLFDLDNQIKQIQNHAQQQVVPILQKKIQEEKSKENKEVSEDVKKIK